MPAGIGGQPVTFNLAGTGTLTNTMATTASDGTASTTLQVSNLSGTVNVAACVNSVPCTTFSVFTVQSTNIKLQKVGGNDQLLLSGELVQPLLMRVTDSSTPPNSLAGIPVMLVGTIFTQPGQPDCSPSEGVCRPTTNNFVSRFSANLMSDANGMVSFTPTIQAGWGSVQLVAIATAGSGAVQSFGLQMIAQQ
jgi:hypothetical protein